MSAVSKAINALNEGLALVVNAGGPLNKAERLTEAENCIRGVRSMLEKEPQGPSPETEDAFIAAGMLNPDVSEDEIDEDPPAEPGFSKDTLDLVRMAIEATVQSGDKDVAELLADHFGIVG